MTFARTRETARSARHLPATGSSRLSSVLGGAGDRMPTAGLAPAQQAAQALIGAEQALVQAESRYVEAKGAWIAESRRQHYADDNGKQLNDAERGLAVADDARQRARDRVDQLRHRLSEQRLRQVPSDGTLYQQGPRLSAPHSGGGQSLITRLLRR
jgi:hypothetical protein